MKELKRGEPAANRTLPDRQMTDNELVLFRAAGEECLGNTVTRSAIIQDLQDIGYTVTGPFGTVVDTDSSSYTSFVRARPPRFFGNGRYQVGPDEFITLTGAQADVLQALVQRRSTSLDRLKSDSGRTNPSAILKTICERHPALAPHIVMPGGKSKGGYSTSIIDQRGK